MTFGDGGLVTLGETLGLLVADDVGPLSLARGMRLSMGGAESNVAIGVARLGVPATWIGRLGDDPIGDLIERQLLAERVQCLAPRDPAPTAIMLRERLATCLQLDAVTYNAFIQEQSLGIHYNTSNDLLDYLTDPSVFGYDDGMVTIPRGPGLGIEVNEEYVRERAREGHRWHNPVWRHAHGSFAEW